MPKTALTAEDWAAVGPIDDKPPMQAAMHRIQVLELNWIRVNTTWQQWQDLLAECERNRDWEHFEPPYPSMEDMLRAHGIEPQIAKNRADFETRPLTTKGGDRRSDAFLHSNQNIEKILPGEGREYLEARMARDCPEILEGLKRGEYRSTRQAAIAAGIIDPDRARRYSLPTDPVAAGRYLARHVDLDWYDAFSEAFLAALEQQG